ncbi:MAG: hypothetical protein AABY00_01075 [Nanoarchaeota archaeon]
MKNKFPTFAVLILIASVIWLLTELKVIKIYIPYIPVIAIILSLGWIINHYRK